MPHRIAHGAERSGLGPLAGRGGMARVGRCSDADGKWNAAEKGDAAPRGLRLRPALPERIGDHAAGRAGIARHILDKPDHRHAGLVEQVDRARRVDQREILRGGDDQRAGRLEPLEHGKLDIAGAGRQVHHQQLGIAPMRVDQLAERVARHRPAPGDRLSRLDQLAHRQQAEAERGRHRVELLVPPPRDAIRHRAGAFGKGRKYRHRPVRRACPARANATARLAATVDLPTPPLPLPTAISRGPCARSAVSATRTVTMPGMLASAALAAASRPVRSGASSPETSITTSTVSPFRRGAPARPEAMSPLPVEGSAMRSRAATSGSEVAMATR